MHSECVSVALGIQMQCACAILLSVASLALLYFSTLSHKQQDFRAGKFFIIIIIIIIMFLKG